MSVCLIALDKLPIVRPVGIRETWIQSFAKCVLKVTGPEAGHASKDDHICEGLKAGINGEVHEGQYIWDANSIEENWEFLLVEKKNVFNEINKIGMLWTVFHLWLSGDVFKNFYHKH